MRRQKELRHPHSLLCFVLMGAHFAHDATAATGNGSSHFQLCTSPCSHCGYNGSNLPSHFKVSYFVYLYIQVLFRRKNIPGCGVNVQEVARESSRKVSSLIRKHLSAEFKPWCVCVCVFVFSNSAVLLNHKTFHSVIIYQ